MNKPLYYKITQSDIDRVPCPRIFDTKTNKIIQNGCKYVLEKSMKRIDGYKNDEVGILINLETGKILAKFYGNNGRINIDEEVYTDILFDSDNEFKLAFIHNHPNNSYISFQDILMFLTGHSLKLLIAVSNNGTISYAEKLKYDQYQYVSFIRKIMALDKINGYRGMIILSKIKNNSSKLNLRFGISNRRRVG